MTMKIYVKPVNIGSIEQEYYEIEVKETQNLREVYQSFKVYLEDQLNCNEDQYDIDIDRIAILQESRPNTKLTANAIINEIVLQGKSDKFTFTFPRNCLPIVQIHDGEKYFYIDYYGKNELLYFIITQKQDAKSIILRDDYEYIKINGSIIDYNAEKDKPFKGFLENRMNMMVNVFIKLKEKKDSEKKKEIVKQSEVMKIEQIKMERKDVRKKDEMEKIEPQKNQQKRQPKKQQRQQIKKEERLQQPQRNLPIQEPQAPANHLNEQPNKDLLKLIIKFQSNISNKRQEFILPVDPAKTMLQLLPQIIQQLKSKGFDWQYPGFDISKGDMEWLRIIYLSFQFRKLERPLKSFVNFPQQSKMFFTFERLYGGGT